MDNFFAAFLALEHKLRFFVAPDGSLLPAATATANASARAPSGSGAGGGAGSSLWLFSPGRAPPPAADLLGMFGMGLVSAPKPLLSAGSSASSSSSSSSARGPPAGVGADPAELRLYRELRAHVRVRLAPLVADLLATFLNVAVFDWGTCQNRLRARAPCKNTLHGRCTLFLLLLSSPGALQAGTRFPGIWRGPSCRCCAARRPR